MKGLFLAALVAAVFILPLNSLSAAEVNHPVISQVQITAGPGKTTSDFIELYNPNSEPFDLKGYRLVKRTKASQSDTLVKSFTESIYIPPKGYFLWANSSYLDIPIAPDVTTSATLSDDNGAALRLGSNDTGTLIDSVAWGESVNGLEETAVYPQNPTALMSLVRVDNLDTNNNSADFSVISSAPRNSSVYTGQPDQQPQDYVPQQDIIPVEETEKNQDSGGQNLEYNNHDLLITEILPNPFGRDSGSEWVEIYNAGTKSVDLSDWFFDDEGEGVGSSAYTVPEGTVIAVQSYQYFIIPTGSFALNNTNGDCLRLLSPDELLQRSVCYTETADEGASYGRNIHGAYEWTDTPTPGAANVFASAIPQKSEMLDAKIVISELFPNPADDEDEEFIELYNEGEEDVDLVGWQVGDEKRTYIISIEDFYDTSVPSKGFFVIPRTVSKIALNNTGFEQVRLLTPDGKIRHEVAYENSVKEEYTYSRNERGVFSWTSVPTPGKENIFNDEDINGEGAFEEEEIAGKVAGTDVQKVSISEAKTLPLGSGVMVEGVVSAPVGLLGKDILYLEGSGIRVHLRSDTKEIFSMGDTVQLSGTLKNYRNELTLETDAEIPPLLISVGQQVDPVIITTGVDKEKYEGYLVRVAGEVVSTSGDIFYIDDGSGEVRIYIMESTGIDKPRMRTGDYASVIGIVSQYDDIYRILPRFNSDIEVGSISAGRTLPRTGSGMVLGTVLLIFAALVILEMSWSLAGD